MKRNSEIYPLRVSAGVTILPEYDSEPHNNSAEMNLFHQSFTATLKSVFLILMVFIVAGCSLEQTTRGSNPNNGMANSQNGTQSSSVGSIRLDADSLNRSNIIRPGDQIQITVWGYPEFNTTTTVKDFGTITVPLIGEVIAAGLTVGQFSEQLKQRLSEYVKGDVRLTISHIGLDQRISVIGEVGKQGNYPALTDLSLVEIIAEAGGTTPTADLKHIKIFRQGIHSDVIEIDLTRYLEEGNIEYIPKLHPGDTVIIPEKQDFVKDFSTYAAEIVFLFSFFTLLR